ncbi:MAG TPA: DUF4349 domain-containing protein [Thermoanaerobaculia bacterium]|nr:DUF4349 domain-containing protein [Thermoanaerobaculia bacterium]
MKKTVLALLLLLLTLACSKQTAELSAARPAAAPAPMIVRRAAVSILVDDTAKTIETVTRNVEAGGGYVASSNVWRDGDVLRAHLTLRVPAAKLTPMLATIRRVSKRVEREVVSSEDVTQEYVDVDARLRNLEATEHELRELLTVARVNSRKASEVLEVHQQLTEIRGEIEQAKGRVRYLSQVTSLSAVDLDIVPDALAPGWQPLRVAREATGALVKLMQNVGTAAIWFVIYLLPLLLIVTLLVAVPMHLAKRFRGRIQT